MPLTRRRRWSAASRSAIFVSSGTANGSSSTGVSYVPVGRRPIVEARPVAQGGRAGPGDPDGFGGDAVGLGGGQDVRRRRSPTRRRRGRGRRTLALARGDAFDPAGLDRDALLEPPNDPDVGVLAPWAEAVSRARSVRSRMRRASVSEGARRAMPFEGRLRSPSEGRRAANAWNVRYRPSPKTRHDASERNDAAEPAERRAGVDAIEPAAGEDEREADAAHDQRHPEPERDDEDEPEGGSAGGDRAEEDQQRAGRRDEAAGQAEDEQASPGDRRAGRRAGGCGATPPWLCDGPVGVAASCSEECSCPWCVRRARGRARSSWSWARGRARPRRPPRSADAPGAGASPRRDSIQPPMTTIDTAAIDRRRPDHEVRRQDPLAPRRRAPPGPGSRSCATAPPTGPSPAAWSGVPRVPTR